MSLILETINQFIQAIGALEFFNIAEKAKEFGTIVGVLIIAFTAFAESGLLIGFMLPGDSLLFTAGFLASQGFFNIFFLSIATFIGAVAGDSVGYSFGKRVGPKIFERKDSMVFKQSHLEKAQGFYDKHGGKAIIIARFMPIIRTFAPILAGVSGMHYRRFLIFNLVGAILWAIGITWLGFILGSTIPQAEDYLLPTTILIIIISVLPSIYHLIKDRVL
ncbi:VTT domain-containing protein [Candidatus Saccharibacteria bacterium]|nr:VTT domain-containing protein [Candidatus Saccharibacteria bacterium]